jgi:uncharacterized cupredoxin-like copper-binding protein
VTLRPAAIACVLAAALAATPARPGPPEEAGVTIVMSNFRYSPEMIALVHGRAYALELSNTARGGHNFMAPDFFAAAQVDPADRAGIVKGGVELAGGERVTIHLVAPAPGRYRVRCTHLFHRAFGMSGEIVVS